MRWLAALLLAACGTDTATYGDPVDDPELPPRGARDLDAWLAAGHYLGWACEPAPVPPRDPSPHRPAARTCSNAALAGSTAPHAIGAASVKEMFDDTGAIMGYGVSRKLADGGALAWYWYEILDGRVKVDGVNTGSCPGCHEAAADYTFVVVTPPRT